MKTKYNLKAPRFYNYLNQSDCVSIEGVSSKAEGLMKFSNLYLQISDAETFKHTLTAMAVSGGINEQEKQDVFCLLYVFLISFSLI